MIVIPAIDLRDGKCVQLVGGVFGSEKFVIDDVDSVAKNFYSYNIKRLHIVDLNAAKSIGDNFEIIKRLLKSKKCKVEVGGGVRSLEKARELIISGADYIIVGTAAVKEPEFLINLSKEIGKDKIILSLDYKGEKVVISGWDVATEISPIEFGNKVKDYCGAFLMTCVDKEGRMKGPDLDYLKEVVDALKVPIIASGGISSNKDLEDLKKIGVYGAVIGMALYEGKIDMKKAVDL